MVEGMISINGWIKYTNVRFLLYNIGVIILYIYKKKDVIILYVYYSNRFRLVYHMSQ